MVVSLCVVMLVGQRRPQQLFAEEVQESKHVNVSFTVAIASAPRPGPVSYVTNCVLSNYCAFAAVGGPSTWPAVALVNTEVPPGRHLSQLAQTPRVQHYLRNGLTLVNREVMPALLHEPLFVLELVSRTQMTQQVSQGCRPQS
jgi:hypothetical protein